MLVIFPFYTNYQTNEQTQIKCFWNTVFPTVMKLLGSEMYITHCLHLDRNWHSAFLTFPSWKMTGQIIDIAIQRDT